MSTPSTSGGNPFRAILDVGAALVSSLELETVFANVAQRIGEAMMVSAVDIQTYDRERGVLIYEAYWSVGGVTDEDRDYIGTVTDIAQRLDWARITERGEMVEQHVDDAALPSREREAMTKWGYKTTLDAPLSVGGKVIGLLGLSETRFVRHFTPIEKDLFAQLCDLAAVAIHNAQVFRRQEEQTRQIDALLGASRALTSSTQLDEVLSAIARTAAIALGCPECVMYEYDAAADAWVWQTMYPFGRYPELGDRVGKVYPVEGSESDRALLERGETVVEMISDPDLPAGVRAEMEEWGEKTNVSVPLRVEDQTLGLMILVENGAERQFADAELELARGLGEQAAAAIRNARGYRRQQEEARRVRALLEVGQTLSSTVAVGEVLDLVVAQAAKALEAPQAVVYEYDAATDHIAFRAVHSVSGTSAADLETMGSSYALDEYPGERRIVHGTDVVIENLSDPDLPTDRRRDMQEYGEKTCLSVPLRYGGKPVGILRIYAFDDERRFARDEIDLARGIGEQAAVAISNARQFDATARQKDRLGALLDANRAITSRTDLKDVLHTVAESAARALGSDECVIHEFDEARDALVWRALYPMESYADIEERVGTVYPLDDTPADRDILAGGRPVVETLSDPDLADDARASMEEWGEKTCLNVPLMYEGEALGIMVLIESRNERSFEADELDLAMALGEQAAIAIRKAQAYETERQETRRVRALLDVGQAIGSTVDLDEVLERVTREACRALDVSSTSVYEYDARTDRYAYRALHLAVPSDVPDDDLGTWYDMADFPGDRVIMLSDVPVVHHLSDPDLPPDRRMYMSMYDEQTVLNVPLRFGDERLGILRYYVAEQERRFSDDEVELARGIGEQAAIAIANARLYDRVERARSRTNTLLDASRMITSTVDLDEVLARVTSEACRALGVDSTAVYEHDARGGGYVYRALYEAVPAPAPDDTLGTWYSLADYPGERAIMLSDVPVVHHLSDPDLAADRRTNMEEFDEQTVLNVPLRFGDQRLGVLRFYTYGHERQFSDDEIELARGLGEQASIAIANAGLYDRAERARERTNTLLDASRALATSLEPDEVFAAITRRAAEALDAPRCGIYEFDKVAETLTARSFYETEPTEGYSVLDVPESIDRRPGDKAILDGGRVVVERTSDDSLDPATRAEMEFWDEKTTINAPLVFRGEPLGILMVIYTGEAREFSSDEMTLATALAEQAAVAMYNARLYQRVQRERERTQALFEASSVLTSTLVREEVYALVAQRAAATFGSPRCDLYEYDAEPNTLTLRGFFEEVPSGLYADIGTSEPLDDRPGDRAILESGEIVVQHVSDETVDPVTRAEMVEWGERTCLNVPVSVKGEPLGLLIITETDRERRFSTDELDLARGLGEQVGMALQNARLYAHLETQNRRLLSLLQSSREMTGAMDVEKAVATMCTEIAGLLDCPVCHIDVGLRDEGGRYVSPEVVAAPDGSPVGAEPPMVPDDLAEQALAERQPVQAGADTEGGSRLVIPLLAKDEPSGFVELSGPLQAAFGSEELEAVQILANQAAVAIDNARLLQERERQAITDGLTGLYNHRFFYDRLRSELARSLRYFTPISLLMLDVDDFKAFNDTYGHLAGDEVLRTIGRLLQQGVRQHVDLPCRYGGEEFVVILPNTPVPGAQAVGERLKEQVESVDDAVAPDGGPGSPFARAEQPYTGPERRGSPRDRVVSAPEVMTEAGVPIPNPDGAAIVGERIRSIVEGANFTDERGEPLRRVTVSIGVAAFPEHAVNVDDLVAAADKALYAAKGRGKNRVVVSDCPA